MTFRKVLKLIPVMFCTVTTIFFFILGIQSIIFFPDVVFKGPDILFFLFMTFLTTLPTFILIQKDTASRLERIIKQILHFLVSGCLVFGFLIYLGYLIMETAIYAIIMFSFMYIAGYVIMEIRDRKLAAKLNERIVLLQNDNAQQED